MLLVSRGLGILLFFILGVGFWDICCGHALNRELGGGCYYLDGTEITYPMNTKEFLAKPFFIGPSKEKNLLFLKTLNDNNFNYE